MEKTKRKCITKFGITEQGDPSLDFSWVNKLHKCSGAIIISKGFNDKFNELLLSYKNKLIYHCTLTGFGGTILEPNVPVPSLVIKNLKRLVKNGFPSSQIVIRVDPILPLYLYDVLLHNTTCGDWIRYLIHEVMVPLKITRMRYSYLDIKQNVRDRFYNAGIELPSTYTLPLSEIYEVERLLQTYSLNQWGIVFESCGERDALDNNKVSCVSEKDFNLLNISVEECIPRKYFIRPFCRCLNNKYELLNSKYRCGYKCLYCYWPDINN